MKRNILGEWDWFQPAHKCYRVEIQIFWRGLVGYILLEISWWKLLYRLCHRGLLLLSLLRCRGCYRLYIYLTGLCQYFLVWWWSWCSVYWIVKRRLGKCWGRRRCLFIRVHVRLEEKNRICVQSVLQEGEGGSYPTGRILLLDLNCAIFAAD